jgi:DNA repair protein RadC
MLLRECVVSYKTKRIPELQLKKIARSDDAHAVLRKLFELASADVSHREMVVALYLSNSNNVVGWHLTGVGGITGCVVDPRVVFSVAVTVGATGLILCHNHPSGKLNPSETDITLTKRFKDCGSLLDITLYDHIIINPAGQYYSFADQGTL